MNFFEIALVAGLLVLIGGAFVTAYRSPDKTLFWNPLTLFATLFAYYFVFGPLVALATHNTILYGFDLRDMMWKAWLAGLLGLGSIYLGFAIRVRRFHVRLVPNFGPELRKKFRKPLIILFGLGFVGFLYDAYVSGHSLAELLLPWHSGEGLESTGTERQGVAAGSYLFLMINVFIPAMCLLAALLAEKNKIKSFLLVGLPALQVAFFYTSVGFRHRIVILILSLTATFYLMRRSRPSPGTLGLGSLGIVLLSGLVVLTRSYGQGLDLTKIASLSLTDIFLGGFADAGTFFTMGLVIDSFPSTVPYVGLDPFWIAATIPIPRELWPGKPYPVFLEYFEYITGTRGQAVPVTGEHYMMAGWFGIVIGGMILGMIYRCFWEFYRANPRNPVVVAMYAVSWALVFPVVNRGYLAQTLMEFFFDFLPLVVLYFLSRKLMLLTGPRLSVRMKSKAAVSVRARSLT